ncbi:MAG TPA: CPBP family intramembrane glutamic endopeptidase [Planctomycetaceae bacterium]
MEALLWIAGFFLLEIAGAFVWQAGIVAYDVGGRGNPAPASPGALQALVESYLPSVMPWMVGTIKFAEVIAALAAIRLRFGRRAFRVTGFRPVPAVHGLILGLAVLPTAFLSGQSYALIRGYWDRLARHAPWLNDLDGFSSIEAVQEMAASTPLLILVFVIAVLPALNEEFVFRAAIGRGLLGRYGLAAGIALTSMLFAAVHLSPVHAAALLPLAVLMHVGYLSSGSIWAPVGVHFLNNALSVGLMKLATLAPEVGGVATDVTESKFSPILFVASAACVAATVWLLMKVRVRWRLPDGREWRPERPGVEPPPPGLPASPIVPTPPVGPVATAAVCYVLYPVAVVAGFLLQQV